MHCVQDVTPVPSTSKPTWVRISDPSNPYTSISKFSQHCLAWLGSCFQHSPSQPIADSKPLQLPTHAQRMGRDVVWFAETWNMSEVRPAWPCLMQMLCISIHGLRISGSPDRPRSQDHQVSGPAWARLPRLARTARTCKDTYCLAFKFHGGSTHLLLQAHPCPGSSATLSNPG